MTKLLDRMLTITAAKLDAAAGCPPDPYTDTWVKCSGSTYLYTCTRHCSTGGNCKTNCTAYGCICEIHPASCGHHYS